MKTRILLVDDEPLLLEAMSRGLRSLRGDLETAIAESGEQALKLLAESHFDVVVSDMRMPGMTGTQLLRQVSERYPQTARLILSGYADPNSILDCVSYTHQYLPKPCDTQTLKAAVTRATSPGISLNNETLKDLVGRMDRLPSVPTLYAQIIEKLQSPETDLEEIAEIIIQDMAMTAKILKLVNSGYFGLARELTSPSDAVLYLGLDTIKCLVLSIHAFSELDDAKMGKVSLELLWNHSLETAAACRTIAAVENAPRKLIDHAFVGGMLHDTGKLVLASNFPTEYEHAMHLVEHADQDLRSAERQIFGAHHAEVGGYLLGLWGLPTPVVDAIGLHHSPGDCVEQKFNPATVVHAANALVHARKNTDPDAAIDIDHAYLARLGLEDRVEIWAAALQEESDEAAASR